MNILTATADGSFTLYNETIGEHYHSKHGALQESKHVFIEAGLKKAFADFPEQSINILEVGFGTGLNYIVSRSFAESVQRDFNYTGIEAFPLTLEELQSTQYQQYVAQPIWNKFEQDYQQTIAHPAELSSPQYLQIAHTTLQEFTSSFKYDLIYFDAFSVQHQPELWSDEIITRVCTFLKPGGIFVTYAITGKLKRALKSCGMEIEKLPGAPGKREMLRARKLIQS